MRIAAGPLAGEATLSAGRLANPVQPVRARLPHRQAFAARAIAQHDGDAL